MLCNSVDTPMIFALAASPSKRTPLQPVALVMISLRKALFNRTHERGGAS
jgi:hypothetical protein